ncbi:MAG TPA: TIGR04282 family arsenosugar biosynthesis glycosyltransferase [Verrucomicrobiae bacterium]|nr:TIGR04282 family arsenosugar biosynthesis glycosyltransferase [Verrucomicrobiae bacterium]
MAMQCALIIFVKAPRPGQVKTRLAKSIGAEAACAAYRQLTETMLDRISPLSGVQLRYTPDDAFVEIQPWLRPGWKASAQGPGDLGQRLHASFVEAFNQGAERVVVIGSDCPDVTAGDIETAWAALTENEVVIGPATDGGYWLIGLRGPQAMLFEGIAWSSNSVFQDTMEHCQTAGLSVKLLRELTDVDTETDWLAFSKTQASQR